MRKLFTTLLLIPIFILSSCSDDDKDGGIDSASLIGTWDFVEFNLTVNTSEEGATKLLKEIYSQELTDGFTNSRYEFNDKGEFTFYRYKQENEGYIKEHGGTYKVTNDKILELDYSYVERIDKLTIDVAGIVLNMHVEETSGSIVLKANEYPNWERVKIDPILEKVTFKRVK